MAEQLSIRDLFRLRINMEISKAVLQRDRRKIFEEIQWYLTSRIPDPLDFYK